MGELRHMLRFRDKPIWVTAVWHDMAAQVENVAVTVHHIDAHVPKYPRVTLLKNTRTTSKWIGLLGLK